MECVDFTLSDFPIEILSEVSHHCALEMKAVFIRVSKKFAAAYCLTIINSDDAVGLSDTNIKFCISMQKFDTRPFASRVSNVNIKEMKNLRKLVIGDGYYFERCFIGLTKLTSLTVTRDVVLDSAAFSQMPALRTLRLIGDHITVNFIHAVNIQTLILQGSTIGKYQIRYLPTLRSLIFAGAVTKNTGITDKDMKYLPALTQLDHRPGCGITDEGLLYLRGLKSLKLRGGYNGFAPSITDAGLEHMNLDSLEIGCRGVTDAGINQQPNLKTLLVCSKGITDAAFGNLRILESLSVYNNNSITGTMLHTSLRRLDVCDSIISDSALHGNLLYLSLFNTGNITDDGLSRCTGLRHLILDRKDRDFSTFVPLMTSLETLEVLFQCHYVENIALGLAAENGSWVEYGLCYMPDFLKLVAARLASRLKLRKGMNLIILTFGMLDDNLEESYSWVV